MTATYTSAGDNLPGAQGNSKPSEDGLVHKAQEVLDLLQD